MADAVQAATGRTFYREIAIDTVATIVNDLATCGALPISVAMHAAVGESAWFGDAKRMEALVAGWAEGCKLAGAVWGGGETPTLRGIVEPETIVLAGSAIGRIAPKSLRITGDVRAGDAIIFLASSGVQTNGLSLCRLIAEKLPQGYQTPIGFGDSRTYGEALLAPSVIYVAFVRECQRRNLKLKYAAHVTGHGWRKLMRLDEPFVYEITAPRPAPALFRFMAQAGPVSEREMYATFNQASASPPTSMRSRPTPCSPPPRPRATTRGSPAPCARKVRARPSRCRRSALRSRATRCRCAERYGREIGIRSVAATGK